VAKIRTRPKAIERLCQLARELGAIEEMSVMRTTDPKEAEDLAHRLSSIFPPERMYRASIGPAMGTYVGPDAVGISAIWKAK